MGIGNKNKRVIVSFLVVLILLNSTLLIREVSATSVTIQKPTNSQKFNSLLYGDYLTFKFTIVGSYESYKTYIDGYLDSSLHHLGVNINYDAKNFIDKYGRGTHSFTVSVSVSGGPSPFGLDQKGTTTESSVVESVSFTVDPPLCHFVGFGFDYDDEYTWSLRWRSNIEPFRDMLLSSRAKYIPGYFATDYDWDDEHVSNILNTLDTKEKQKDIVVVLFSAHGHAALPPPVVAWTHSHVTTTMPKIGWTPACDGVTSPELESWLSILETDHLLYIMDTCHSEDFLYEGKVLANKKHIMVACEWNEKAWHQLKDYDPSASLADRIDNMMSPFLRRLCERFYLYFDDTNTAFNKAYNHIITIRDDQHPLNFSDLSTEVYLCINHN
ncbi:MAG: hypothetical protein ACTSSG_08655 [Candidatus Heimdallarchaeaceae archaeon]